MTTTTQSPAQDGHPGSPTGMEQRPLGKEGPAISVIGYGAWKAGGGYHSTNPPDEELIDVMCAAIVGARSAAHASEAASARAIALSPQDLSDIEAPCAAVYLEARLNAR